MRVLESKALSGLVTQEKWPSQCSVPCGLEARRPPAPGQSPPTRQILHPSSPAPCGCLGQGPPTVGNLLLDRYNFLVLRAEAFL